MNYDVIVVGAGTAGIYFAYRLAKLGHKVLVIEKDKEADISKRLDIIHFPYDGYRRFGINPPSKNSDEFGKEFVRVRSRSALDTFEKVNKLHVYAVHLPIFNERLRKMAISWGVEFKYEAKFLDFLYDGSNVIGISYLYDDDKVNCYAKLVADGTGIDSILRRKVNSPFMENFEIGNKDRFYVILKCVIYDDPKNETLESLSWPYYKCWIGPFYKKTGGIIGCGASTSFEYCQKMMDKFESIIKLPNYTVDHYEYGSTPYSRSPYSFISNGFIVLGDAACLTNPLSGEGIEYHFGFINDTISVIDEALKEDDLTINNLWKVNYKYYHGFGKETVFTRALVSCLMKMSEEENEYLFEKGIIFKSDDEKQKNVFCSLLAGVFKKRIKFKTFSMFLSNVKKANKLKRHYHRYPLNPGNYFNWVDKANILWEKTGKITDVDG